MSLEQLLSDRDSEDERDDEIMDLEDRRVCIPSTIFYVNLLILILLCKLHIM